MTFENAQKQAKEDSKRNRTKGMLIGGGLVLSGASTVMFAHSITDGITDRNLRTAAKVLVTLSGIFTAIVGCATFLTASNIITIKKK
jgi:hypothetical protein